jgi:hypothetical protein
MVDEPLTDAELDDLDQAAATGDFGTSGDEIQRATAEIRTLRQYAESDSAQINTLTKQLLDAERGQQLALAQLSDLQRKVQEVRDSFNYHLRA